MVLSQTLWSHRKAFKKEFLFFEWAMLHRCTVRVRKMDHSLPDH